MLVPNLPELSVAHLRVLALLGIAALALLILHRGRSASAASGSHDTPKCRTYLYVPFYQLFFPPVSYHHGLNVHK